MKILIVGGGLMGVTSAYVLARSGHQVMVLDRQPGPARETSFANGALLHPSMPEPWNAPGCWRVLLASLGRSDSALQLHWRTLPAIARWGGAFLRNSNPEKFERNVLSNVRLASYSLEVMHTIRQSTQIQYGRVTRGSLRVFRDPDMLRSALAVANQRLSHGLSFRALSRAEAVAIEPALAQTADKLAGAIHYGGDEIGDAHRFCVALTDCARQQGVAFHFNTPVSSIEVAAGRVRAVICGHERFEADQYILAAGSYSPWLLRGLAIQLPVQPAKGYSVTIRNDGSRTCLGIPLIDDQLHAAIIPLDGALRVAGTAEFAGYDLRIQQARIDHLLRLLHMVLPDFRFDPGDIRPWCGLRPMCVDGIPLIGSTSIANLAVNTGHGHLGWTMAAGSAQLMADLIDGRTPAIDPTPYQPGRFATGWNR